MTLEATGCIASNVFIRGDEVGVRLIVKRISFDKSTEAHKFYTLLAAQTSVDH